MCFIGVAVHLQGIILEQDNFSVKPDVEFMELFAGVLGPLWPSLAASLSLSEDEIAQLRRGDVSPQQRALDMLRMWVSTREDATYGQLCQKLKALSLFQCGTQYGPMQHPCT